MQCYCPKKCHLRSCLGCINVLCSKTWGSCPSSLELWAPDYSFLELGFWEDFLPGSGAPQDRLSRYVGESLSLEGFRAWLENATALALILLEQDAGLDFGGVFQLAFFVIFFNILSSFYWSGKYFILTGYKSRLLLNIGWVYLLENSA